MTGEDVPFIQAQISIHQPTIAELSLLGENNFRLGCGLLNISTDLLSDKDKNDLKGLSDFDILMTLIKDKSKGKLRKGRSCVMRLLYLLFPEYEIRVNENNQLELSKGDEKHYIHEANYSYFKSILTDIFCLRHVDKDEPKYNPKSEVAKSIAAQLERGRARAAATKNKGNGNQKTTFLDRYISILSVGLQMSVNDLTEYTIYQLYDVFERYQLKTAQDFYVKAKMAGAKDIEEVEDWRKDLHP